MSAAEKDPEWALDNVRFDSDAGVNLTCREYLCKLLGVLWREQEGFSGKRPFGNSGWDGDILYALEEEDCDASHGFVHRMIKAMAQPAITTLRAQEGA